MLVNFVLLFVFYVVYVLLFSGWVCDVCIVCQGGMLVEVIVGVLVQFGDIVLVIVVLGLGNLYSYVFQCGMVGLIEIGGNSGDSFWSWCELMYCFLVYLQLDVVQVIVEQVYVEMFELGFICVGEFYYLYYVVDGILYVDCVEMVVCIVVVVQGSGIGLILLLVFYVYVDFGGVVFNLVQCCLIYDVDGFVELLQGCVYVLCGSDDVVFGIVLYSLCVVIGDELVVLLLFIVGLVYIYIVEQICEVDVCVVWSGLCLVCWLYEYVLVDVCWCLVYVIYVDVDEVQWMVVSQVVVGLCLIIEVNLGDGLFLMQVFVCVGGWFGVGLDFNVLIDVVEELCLFEYGQCLYVCGCNVFVLGDGQFSGCWLFEQLLCGVGQVLGVVMGLQVGVLADVVELDVVYLVLIVCEGDVLFDSWVFVVCNGVVCLVWCQGCQLVCEGCYLQCDVVVVCFVNVFCIVLQVG